MTFFVYCAMIRGSRLPFSERVNCLLSSWTPDLKPHRLYTMTFWFPLKVWTLYFSLWKWSVLISQVLAYGFHIYLPANGQVVLLLFPLTKRWDFSFVWGYEMDLLPSWAYFSSLLETDIKTRAWKNPMAGVEGLEARSSCLCGSCSHYLHTQLEETNYSSTNVINVFFE